MPHPLHLHHEQCRPDCSESHQGSHFRIEASFLWDEEQAISAVVLRMNSFPLPSSSFQGGEISPPTRTPPFFACTEHGAFDRELLLPCRCLLTECCSLPLLSSKFEPSGTSTRGDLLMRPEINGQRSRLSTGGRPLASARAS